MKEGRRGFLGSILGALVATPLVIYDKDKENEKYFKSKIIDRKQESGNILIDGSGNLENWNLNFGCSGTWITSTGCI